MKTILTLILTTLTLQAETLTLFTGSNGPNGINILTFDTQTGTFTKPNQISAEKNSGFITLSPDKKFLYSTTSKNKTGAVASYSIINNNKLKLISIQPTFGRGTCHISLDQTGEVLLAADYGSGTLTTFKIDLQGRLSPPVSTIHHTGNSTHPGRQTSPHAHSIYTSPNNKHVYAADLGTDKIHIYSLNQKTAELTAISTASLPPGSGPRHLAIHPTGKVIYALNELTCTITTFLRDEKTGTLTRLHTTPVLPDKTQGIACSEIHLTADQKHLYTGNRDITIETRNSISHLTVPTDLTNPPTLKQTLILPIQIPRHFTVTPKGNWLIAAGQNSNNLLAIKRNPTTGHLTLTDSQTTLPKPTCILIK